MKIRFKVCMNHFYLTYEPRHNSKKYIYCLDNLLKYSKLKIFKVKLKKRKNRVKNI